MGPAIEHTNKNTQKFETSFFTNLKFALNLYATSATVFSKPENKIASQTSSVTALTRGYTMSCMKMVPKKTKKQNRLRKKSADRKAAANSSKKTKLPKETWHVSYDCVLLS